MVRKFKMYCVDVDKDGSEFELCFEMNGEVVEREVVYCFDDVLSSSYPFFKKSCEKYEFDGRMDKLEVMIGYNF